MLLIKVLSSTIVFTLQSCNLLPYINLHTYKFIYTNLKSKKSYVIENRPVKMTAYTSVLPFKSINWVKTNTWTPDVLSSDKRFIYDSRSSCTENILRIMQFNSCFVHCVKSICIRSYSGPFFSAFWLSTERYVASLRIQSECWENTDQNNSEYRHFAQWLRLIERVPWQQKFGFLIIFLRPLAMIHLHDVLIIIYLSLLFDQRMGWPL